MRFLQVFKSKTFLQIALLLVGVALLVLGIFGGEVTTILQKATNICLECIGIG